MPTLTQRFMPEGATLASGVREALADGGVAVYLNLDPASVANDVEYEANALPADASPAWTRSQVGDGADSVSGGELTLSATGTNRIFFNRTEAGLGTSTPAYLAARVKITTGTGNHVRNGFWFRIMDGTRYPEACIDVDGVWPNLHTSALRGGGRSATFDTTAYHVYEMCKVNASRIDFYVDSRLLVSVPYADFSTTAAKDFYFGIFDGATTHVIDYIRYKIATLWPTTSPTFDKDFDSGSNDTTWDMSTVKMVENLFGEAGNVKYKYGAGNSAAPTLNGSFLTEAQIQAEADPTGRFLRIQGQLNGDGSQDAGWGGFEIAMTTAAGGISARSLVVQNIGTY